MTTIRDVLPAFLLELKQSNRSTHTQRAYESDLMSLAGFYLGVKVTSLRPSAALFEFG